MRIGELAARTGVSQRSLRYYEKRGLLQARRSDAGWREYDESAVTRVCNVRDLLAVGLRVKDIHRVSPVCLQHDIAETPVCDEAIEMYVKRLADVDTSPRDVATTPCRARGPARRPAGTPQADRKETRETVGADR